MQNIEKLLNLEGVKINAIEIFDNEIICPKCEKNAVEFQSITPEH